jgi:ribosomal protein S3
MAQKTDQKILRLNNNWNYKYFEKKSLDTNKYVYQNLNITNFVKQILKYNNIIMNNIKILKNDHTVLHIYISYFTTIDYLTLKAKKSISNNNLVYFKIKYQESLINNNFKNIFNFTPSLISTILYSLYLYTNKKSKIILTVDNINKKKTAQKQEIKFIKKSLLKLKRYKNNNFFISGITLLYTITKKLNSINLLTQFIANNLKTVKRHKFFFKFIKNSLSILLQNPLSVLKGVKIKVTGRVNGRPRAKHLIILIGSGVPCLTLKSNIDYQRITAFTSKGTIGIKIWAYYKEYEKSTKTNKI